MCCVRYRTFRVSQNWTRPVSRGPGYVCELFVIVTTLKTSPFAGLRHGLGSAPACCEPAAGRGPKPNRFPS
jgi:hypothetical protein